VIVFDTPCARTPAGDKAAGQLEIAFVNNMPDSALRQTERQFGSLLGVAGVPIHLRRYTLSGVKRSDAAAELVRKYYFPIEELWEARPDAVIVTGCEPLSQDLAEEPYWNELVELLWWAQRNTVATLASCLAAHATVLAFDGIARQPLATKRSGVFTQTVAHTHELSTNLPAQIPVPHSRMNDVPAVALVAAGYEILVADGQNGWSVASRKHEDHLCVLMQGHPEYDADTLMLEFRRDVRRYLDRTRPDYPRLPEGYVPGHLEAELRAFEAMATSGSRSPEVLEQFPITSARNVVPWTWRRPAETLYRNWLDAVRERAQARAAAPAVTYA
jgi:homoserine O-succinyltransferase